MAHHHIRITASAPNESEPNNSKLTLSDNGLTIVKPGDHVTWIIEVPAITSILIRDDEHTDLFRPDPEPEDPKNPRSNWKGTIRENFPNGKEESYSIYWSQGGKTYGYDPKIQVN